MGGGAKPFSGGGGEHRGRGTLAPLVYMLKINSSSMHNIVA